MKNKFKIFSIISVIFAGIWLTMFSHFEMGGESWGYWYFARVFAETGKFIIMDRGPLYVLYLNLFRWLGYPLSVSVEFFMTSLIVVVSLIVFFRRYLGLALAVFSSLLWLPFLQTTEPPVQGLALALSCLAMSARNKSGGRFCVSLSYCLFFLAYTLRSIYIIFIVLFALRDIFCFLKATKGKISLMKLLPKPGNWPILFGVLLFLWFSFNQSSNQWNNAWFATTKWAPNLGKTLSDSSFLQHFNWKFIELKYGNFAGRDFYFTNQELFKGADTALKAVLSNPQFVIEQVGRNIKDLTLILVGFTKLSVLIKLFSCFSFTFYLALLISGFIIYGAIRACKESLMRLFLVGNLLLAGITVLSLPKARYMQPMIPVFVLSAYFYGTRICSALKNKYSLTFCSLILPLVIILFSNGIGNWRVLSTDVIRDIRNGQARILENRNFSMKAAYGKIAPLLKNCKGVMALEATFVGAFMDIPINRVYDVWEIPPFGSFGPQAQYKGLQPERVNCLLISNDLMTGIGAATNYGIRYQNYIKPYSYKIKSEGARVYNLDSFGALVILNKS